MAMLYEDYMKVRNAKVGESVVLSTGEKITKTAEANVAFRNSRPTKNTGLDFYDRTYIG